MAEPVILVLGPLAVGGPHRTVRGRIPRALLARLVVGPAAVSVDELADAVWGEVVPPSLHATLKSHISRLRATLRPAVGYDPIASYPGGYRLAVPSTSVDAGQFEAAVRAAASCSPDDALPMLRQALALWRGPAFADLRYEDFAAGEAARLEELRLTALESCLDAELRVAPQRETLAELASLVRQHPLREKVVALHMRALADRGRQRDALSEYERYRAALAEESGLTPSSGLVALQEAILEGQRPERLGPPPVHYARTSGGAYIGYVRRDGGDGRWLMAPGCDAHVSVAHLDDEPLTAAVERRLASIGGLIRLDRPGIGLSDPIRTDCAPTAEEWAEACVAVADHAGIGRFSVIGTGWSTPAAVTLAVCYPGRIRALIIFNGFARFVRGDGYPIGIPPALVERFRDSVLDTSLDVMPAELDDVVLHAPSRAHDASFRSWWRRAGQQGASPAVSHSHFALLFDADVRHLLPRISQPTLILHRRANRYVRPEHGRYLADNILRATYHELDGADQLMASGDARPVLEAIRSFLASV